MMRSYPKIYTLGHGAIRELLLDDVIVEEKVDGSQFSFGVYDGVLRCRSKGKEQDIHAPDKMFNKAIETAKELQDRLVDGWTYRGEYLETPKHNVQKHDRVPVKNVIIYDIDMGTESYLSYEGKLNEAQRLGLEVVPLLFQGKFLDSDLASLLERDSALGGTKIEGVVIKNYRRFGVDKNILIGKYVSERFKEIHKKEWGASNPRQNDILESIIARYTAEGRGAKAVDHLKDEGVLVNEPKDIGKLVPEVQRDVLEEEADEIKELLFKWAWPTISRRIISGLPQWYKDRLAAAQFEENAA